MTFKWKFCKSYCHVWNQQSRIFQNAMFLVKLFFLLIWDQRCLVIVFLGCYFKTVAIMEINTLKLVNSKVCVQNKKKSNLGLHIPYLGFFGCNFEKILPFLKSSTSKVLKVWTKMPYVSIFGLQFEKLF